MRLSEAALRKTFAAGMALTVAALVPALAHAGLGGPGFPRPSAGAPLFGRSGAFVPTPLQQVAAFAGGAQQRLDVIVLGQPSATTDDVVASVRAAHGAVVQTFQSIPAVEALVGGPDLATLSNSSAVRSITPNGRVHGAGVVSGGLWQQAADVTPLSDGSAAGRSAPAIAIVDSGVDPSRAADFGARIVQSVDFTGERRPFTDLLGHGTLVAGIAAGAAPQARGAAPSAPIISLRVVHSDSTSTVADVLQAADWIDANRVRYGIGVANFSLASAFPDYAAADPIDAAVERLWLDGVVVVAAAGNNGPGRMFYAPADDPLVITVGASDIADTVDRSDDGAAPWTSYGATPEGFAKPEVGAPGRWMIGPLANRSVFASAFASHVVAPGYLWLSGTSFAAPVVSGIAAELLALHPGWTPDQVKGALMVSATPAPAAPQFSLGVGEVDGAAAAAVASPPNPNSGLDALLTSGRSGPTVDWSAWQSTVSTDASWAEASWAEASWAEASWAEATWAAASWAEASWAEASWAQASWAEASWTQASWAQASWAETSGTP